MKRKGLTIFFFSVMVLAGMPRAMRHFQNYVAAAQNQAQAELLQLLLNIGAPEAESQTAKLAPQTPQTPQAPQPLACTTPVGNNAQTAPAKPRATAPAIPAQPVALNKKFEFTFSDTALTPAEFSQASAPALEHISAEAEARRHLFVALEPEIDALAPYLSGAKAESLRTLLRGSRSGDKKAACELQREIMALFKASKLTAPVARLRMVKAALDVPAAEAAEPAAREATDRRQYLSDESMR